MNFLYSHHMYLAPLSPVASNFLRGSTLLWVGPQRLHLQRAQDLLPERICYSCLWVTSGPGHFFSFYFPQNSLPVQLPLPPSIYMQYTHNGLKEKWTYFSNQDQIL